MSTVLTYNVLDETRNEIRLLQVLPAADPASSVQCKMFSTFLGGIGEHEPYNALSYVWGDPRYQRVLEVNNVQVQVRASLEMALRAIRKENQSVTIWASELCINQNSIPERNDQVAMMGLVYSKAEAVIAWLGEAGDESDLAFDSIKEWAPFLENVSEIITGPVNRQIVDYAIQHVPLAFESRARLAIEQLGHRAYWTRVWIVQEIMLAKEIHAQCGSKCIDMHLIRDAMGSIMAVDSVRAMGECPPELTDPEVIEHLTTPMFYMVNRLSSKGPYTPHVGEILPVKTIAGMASLDATDPRDKIFGLLGLIAASGEHYQMIKPDYNKTLEQVYIDYGRYALNTSQGLELLMVAGKNGQRRNEEGCLPSWVADWRDKSANEKGLGLYKKDTEEVPTHLSDMIELSDDNRVLKVKGFEIDTIRRVYDGALFPVWRRNDDYGGGSDFQSFVTDFLRPTSSLQGETMLSQYFRLVGINRALGEDKMIQNDQEKYFKSAALFLKYIFVQMQVQQIYPPNSPVGRMLDAMPFALTLAFLGVDAPQEQRERLVDLILNTDLDMHGMGWYEPAIHLRTDGCIPFVTQSGKMGLGTYHIQEGDLICQLATHQLPFVLGAKDGMFVNHGECFVLDSDMVELSPEIVPHMKEFEIC